MSRRSRLRRAAVVVAIGAALVAGCSRNPFPLAPVSGTVTLDGVPLRSGVVSFQPTASQGSQAGPGSTGPIDERGHFVLVALDGTPGAVVGEHRVRIYSATPGESPRDDSDSSVAMRERVPVRYNYESQLRFTVPSQGAANADFHLGTVRPPTP